MIIRDNLNFRKHYQELGKQDKVIGLLNIKPTEEFLFLDLAERGVELFPSALSQLTSRSKCLQASIFHQFMVPLTAVIRDRHDFIEQITTYGKHDTGQVVTKQNRLNCGLGIHIWQTIEDAYNQACFGSLTYPFVLQPFVPDVLDIRVVMFGDYVEAYWRKNPYTLRNNLFFGGKSGVYELSDAQLLLCKDVMERGKYPYAHIDLMVTPNDTTYLSEINLRGGMKGAAISHADYNKKIAELEEKFMQG